jgi:hypothetical protein
MILRKLCSIRQAAIFGQGYLALQRLNLRVFTAMQIALGRVFTAMQIALG